jgi:soluble lytic murein transglycosylase-like protein
MKTYAIIGTVGLVVSLATANVSESDENAISATQTISVPNYEINFVRGSYELIEANYDSKTQLSDEELDSILRQAGFSGNELKMARAIVFYESTNRPMALNKSSNCYGLFQINMTGSMGPARREKYDLKSNDDLYNPLINAQIAYHMSNGGKNWSAWSTENAAKKSITQTQG